MLARIGLTCLVGMLWLMTLSAQSAQADCAASKERMERVHAALKGQPDALAEFKSRSDDSGFNSWVVAAAYQREGNIAQADHYYRLSLKNGDLLASLALAQMYHDQGQHQLSHAWAQVSLLRQFSIEDIRAGEADRGMGMFLLRHSLANMSEEQITEAEALSAEFLRDWLPEKAAPEQICPGIEASTCAGWVATRRSNPRYPAGMAHANEPGWVRALLQINENGRVDHVEILGSSRRAFERTSASAIRRWRFTPPEEASSGTLATQTIVFELR
jgi:TonB family protein